MTSPTDAVNWTSPPVLVALFSAGIALTATLLSFVASWLTNRSTRQQLEARLRHDASQRDRDRSLALKRDIYIPVSESITRTLNALGQLAKADANQAEIGARFAQDIGTLGKIHVVGSEETVRAVMAYVNAAAIAYFELATSRDDLIIRKQATEDAKAVVDQANSELREIDDVLMRHRLSGNDEASAIARLIERRQTVEGSRNVNMVRFVELLREQALVQMTLIERAAAMSLELSPVINDVILAARQDLEIPVDADEFRRIHAEHEAAIKRAADRVIEIIRQKLQPKN